MTVFCPENATQTLIQPSQHDSGSFESFVTLSRKDHMSTTIVQSDTATRSCRLAEAERKRKADLAAAEAAAAQQRAAAAAEQQRLAEERKVPCHIARLGTRRPTEALLSRRH